MIFPEEKTFREEWVHDSEDSEDEAKDGYQKYEHPPDPEKEEVLLVEQIVPKNAQDVLNIVEATVSSVTESALDFCGEHFAHRIV